MSEPIPSVVLRWKRKGGRAVAEAPGFLFRVEDDGAFAVQLPSGAWQHGRAIDAAVAKANCAGMAQAGCTFLQGESAALEARRQSAAELAAIPPEERGFAAGVAKLLVMVAHDHIAPSEISARLPPASMREIFETLTADAEVMAAVASRTREQSLRHLEDTILGSFQSIREEKEGGSDGRQGTQERLGRGRGKRETNERSNCRARIASRRGNETELYGG